MVDAHLLVDGSIIPPPIAFDEPSLGMDEEGGKGVGTLAMQSLSLLC